LMKQFLEHHDAPEHKPTIRPAVKPCKIQTY
jgi:hypothetical protein